jgi:hypothetical protein
VLSLADILALPNGELNNTLARTMLNVTAGAGLYTYIVYASSAGNLSSIVQNGVTQVLTSFTRITDVTGENAFTATVTYAVYRSNAVAAFNNVTLVTS